MLLRQISQIVVYWPAAYLAASAIGRRRLPVSLLLLACACVSATAEQPPVRAALQPVAERQSAPDIALKDRAGKPVNLKKYRGKVVMLDFWATWCTGCKQEIPWFSEFQKNYGKKGLAVVGVAMDGEGWKIVKPFLAEHSIPYRIVTGDDSTAKGFGIDTLPDTFLIDRRGRVAAAYPAGLVDRENVEANIQALLAQRQ
jgi:cytochrome c biogenesis protein CcmG/thiol:disulfide interchange protein DsbE